MLDNLGNPSGYFILDEEGRVFMDDDGFADEIADFTKLAKAAVINQRSASTVDPSKLIIIYSHPESRSTSGQAYFRILNGNKNKRS